MDLPQCLFPPMFYFQIKTSHMSVWPNEIACLDLSCRGGWKSEFWPLSCQRWAINMHARFWIAVIYVRCPDQHNYI